ncbi:hypothetical protein [Nautilia lithotrophica]
MKVIYLTKDKLYINENDRIVKKELSYEKGIVTSSIGYNHILNITFKLPKDLDKEMLEVEAEKYIFTEGSLDYAKEYKINYIFKEYEDYINVEAFVVETEVLKKEFEKYLKVFKYIDFISAKPFIFKSYYDITNVTPQNDAFVYFDENEAFLSCFENGEFVFVKSISKLSTLSKQLNLSVEETKKLLLEKGLDETKYEDLSVFSIVDSFFSQLFMKVSNLINYSVSYYGLTKINNIFFYSPFDINKLFDSYTNFWNLSGVEFKKYIIETDYDPFDYTAVIYNTKHFENENENFSVFPKPVPFYKKKSGILLLLIIFSFSFVGIDAFFKYQTIEQKETQILSLKKKILRIKKEEKLLLSAIKKYKTQINELKSENNALQKQISDISDKVLFLENIQRSKLTSNELADLVYELKKYNLKLLTFNKNKDHIDLIILSEFGNSANVAKLMKDMYNLGYKNVTSTEIENKNGIYIAKVSYDE